MMFPTELVLLRRSWRQLDFLRRPRSSRGDLSVSLDAIATGVASQEVAIVAPTAEAVAQIGVRKGVTVLVRWCRSHSSSSRIRVTWYCS